MTASRVINDMINRNQADPWNELRVCQDHESLLLSDLLRLLDKPCSSETRQSLLEVLDRLLVNLPRHLELACHGGYLTDVMRIRPNWHRQVESLRTANMCCISTLHHLREQIQQDSWSTSSAAKESGEIGIWIRSLVSIRGQESRLLQAAFTLDIGGEA